MDVRYIRKILKTVQPDWIKRYLIPDLWFKEDDKELEYWIFFYAFCYRFSDDMISQRLGYAEPSTIYRRTLKIIENNKSVIESFLREAKKIN